MKLKTYLSEQRGRAAALARDIGVTPVTIHQWAHRPDKKVPAERCPEIEKATGGLVTCEEMRPDVDWAYLRSTDAKDRRGHDRRDGERRDSERRGAKGAA